MNPEKDETIKRLLEDSKDMIASFEALTGSKRQAATTAELQRATIEGIEEEPEPAADAYFDLFVEEDAMAVTAEFRPPAGGGQPLTVERIEKALVDKAVVHGVLWDEVAKALSACNLDLKMQQAVVIARGTPPVPFVPEHLRLDERLVETHVEVPEKASVDFKEITPFIMVQKDQILAFRVAEAFGTPGTDVLGREVPFPTLPMPLWRPGLHVVAIPEGCAAELDGRLILTSDTFGVNPVLELAEGVDYRTGNIRFRGEVLLKGKVSAGFTVEAGGSLVCSDVFDAFSVKVGGDLTSTAGVIGNGDGRLEIGGKVVSKFLEHVYLLAEGTVHVESAVLNSVVKTRDKLVLGDKGILAGGQINALNGVEAFQIGTVTGPRTQVSVGQDFQGVEQILWIRNRTKDVAAQLKKVDAALPYGGARVGELIAAAKKLRIELAELAESARVQLLNLVQNEEASVIVRGSVYQGTLVEVCNVQFLVNQKLSAVRFFLDKRRGSVAVEALTQKEPRTATPSAAAPKKR
jgi:uncharacterized protein (DUF342 family)